MKEKRVKGRNKKKRERPFIRSIISFFLFVFLGPLKGIIVRPEQYNK